MKSVGLVALLFSCCAVGCLGATRFNLFDRLAVKTARNEECSQITCAPEGGSCNGWEPPGPMCRWDQGCNRNHVCEKLPVKGDKCFESSMCRYPYTCTNGTRCVVAGVGDSCRNTEDCSGPFLCREGICRMAQYARQGEKCDPWTGPKCDVAAGIQCSWNDGICIKAHTKKEGDPCRDSLECQLTERCDGVCYYPLLQKSEGESCLFFECKEGLVCSGFEGPGVCIKPGYVPVGKQCTVSAECGMGGTCQCSLETGNMTCFRIVPSAQKYIDQEVAITKCLERYRFEPEERFRCQLEHAALAKILIPWQVSCVDPADGIRPRMGF